MSAQRPSIRQSRAAVGPLRAAALVPLSTVRSSATEPPNALVPTTVEVPLSLRTTPFDEDRVLMVPHGFKISVVARILLARFIMPLSAGDILVATPSDGTISLVQIQADGTATVSSLIEDLHNPHGMALHQSDDETILFRTSGDLHLAHEFSLRSSKSIDLVPGPAVYGSGQSEIGDFATVSKKGLSALCH
jgi:hypothetical protein